MELPQGDSGFYPRKPVSNSHDSLDPPPNINDPLNPLNSPLSAVDEAVKVCAVEQVLTQQCLRVNPKSYCVWLHRQWVMERSPRPDWESERQLCDLFLKYDERNCTLVGGGAQLSQNPVNSNSVKE